MLGVAQCTSRLFLLNKSLPGSFLLGGVTAALYLLAIIQWIRVLKSMTSLTSAYAIVVLGVFAGIFFMKFLKLGGTSNISAQDLTGILLIAAGSALIKR